jgi:hypothetical protein
MKLILTSVVSIVCLYICLAQTANQTVYPTKNLDAYAGIWEYATATDTFRVVLKKGIESRPRTYYEVLIGGYRHVKNGVVVGDYTKGPIPSVFLNKDLSEGDEEITINGTNALSDPDRIDPNEIRILFKDRGLGKMTQSGRMTLLSPTQARWILKDDEGDYALLPGEQPPIMGFSVPTDVIMNKVVPPPPSPLPPLPPPGPGGGGNDELLPPL